MDKEYRKRLAYYLWLEDGKPNGEEFVDCIVGGGKIKIKERHWNIAGIMSGAYIYISVRYWRF